MPDGKMQMTFGRREALAGALVVAHSAALAEHSHAPKMQAERAVSIFDAGLTVTRADGKRLALDSLRGRATVATMFFATCPDVCPLMIDGLSRVYSGLPRGQQTKLQVLVVSFDAERDQPAVLRAYTAAHGLPSGSWTVAVADPVTSERLGTLLDVRFRRIGSGSFSHVPMISLIRPDGVTVARLPSASLDTPLFGAAVAGLLAS